MSREALVPLVTDEAASSELREQYGFVAQAMGRVPNLARVIANCESLFGPFMGLAGAVAMEHKLPMPLKELAVMRASELNGCGYCKGMHGPIMKQMGIDDQKIDAVSQKDLLPGLFSEQELAVLRLTDEMTENVAADPETVKKARQLFGEEATVELMMTIAFYNLMNRMAESSGVPLEG